MKKTIVLFLTFVMLFSLCACGGQSGTSSPDTQTGKTNSEVGITNPQSAGGKSTGETSPTQAADGAVNAAADDKQVNDSGILALFTGGYETNSRLWKRAVLAWVNPESGDYSIYRDFNVPEGSIGIGPIESGIVGRECLRQHFNLDYGKIVAHDSVTGSYGWVDSNGEYTSVTDKLPLDGRASQEIKGVGFHKDYYYLYCCFSEYPLDEKVYRISTDDIDSASFEEVPIYDRAWAVFNGTPDYKVAINKGKCLIQTDSSSTYAIPYTTYSEVFFDEIGGLCVPVDYYSDWISSDKAIYQDNLTWQIYIISSGNISDWDKSGWEERYNNRKLILEPHGTQIRPNIYEYNYVNIVVNPEKTEFACLGSHIVNKTDGSGLTEGTYIGIFTLEGENIRTLSNENRDGASYYSIRVDDGIEVRLNRIVDWS